MSDSRKDADVASLTEKGQKNYFHYKLNSDPT
jgi:hypothetical protein